MNNEFVSVPRDAAKWALKQLEEDGNKGCGYFDTLLSALAQHQGEPVACVKVDFNPEGASGHLVWFTPSSFEPGQEIKLYTHAAQHQDEPGEVEQGYHHTVVEGLLNGSNELREERDTLRAQLAELSAAADYFAGLASCETIASYDAQQKLLGILIALSASAEPSAPVCDSCKGWGFVETAEIGSPCAACEGSGWQARAALESNHG